jgi:hypothetical protein
VCGYLAVGFAPVCQPLGGRGNQFVPIVASPFVVSLFVYRFSVQTKNPGLDIPREQVAQPPRYQGQQFEFRGVLVIRLAVQVDTQRSMCLHRLLRSSPFVLWPDVSATLQPHSGSSVEPTVLQNFRRGGG